MPTDQWIQGAVWVGLILLLGVIEIFTLDFIFLMLAVGSAAALISAVLGTEWWVSLIVAAVVSLLLLALVRPRLFRALGRNADPHKTNIDALIGMHGIVAVRFEAGSPGQVHLANGETWSAMPVPGQTPPDLNAPIIVERIEGSTAVVRPEGTAS